MAIEISNFSKKFSRSGVEFMTSLPAEFLMHIETHVLNRITDAIATSFLQKYQEELIASIDIEELRKEISSKISDKITNDFVGTFVEHTNTPPEPESQTQK